MSKRDTNSSDVITIFQIARGHTVGNHIVHVNLE